jgi:predicted phosphoribosyltransferase
VLLRNPIFADRRDAGLKLARALEGYRDERPVVLALPRGGVPVAFEVAKALHAPLDVVLVRKIGAPGHPELGLGALVDGARPHLVVNRELAEQFALPPDWIEREAAVELQEIERRRGLYRGDVPPTSVRGRTVLVIDDGIATGASVRAVLEALAMAGAGKIVLAVPVAPIESLERLRPYAAEIIALATPEPFWAVGPHYADFTQTEDEEVVRLLEEARAFAGPQSHPAE